MIGLGLGDPKDITVKGLEIVKRCERVYLESYTSILTCGQEKLVSQKSFRLDFLHSHEKNSDERKNKITRCGKSVRNMFNFFRRNSMAVH